MDGLTTPLGRPIPLMMISSCPCRFVRLISLLLAGLIFGIIDCPSQSFAERPSTSPAKGLRKNPPEVHALLRARIVISPQKELEQGTLVIRRGVITAVGTDVEVPAEARRWDLSGKTVYPGLIDALSKPLSAGESQDHDHDHAESRATATGDYWNGHVQPQHSVLEEYSPDNKLEEKYRRQGIVARTLAPARGVIRGTSAVVTTGEESLRNRILNKELALHLQLTPPRGHRRSDGYPASPMGAVALVRQAFYDARWYSAAWKAFRADRGLPRPEINRALEALQACLSEDPTQRLPVVVDTPDELYALRADAIARELDLQILLRGSGREYRRLEALAQAGWPILVPVRFPGAPDVRTPGAERQATYERLMHWDYAPENPARLAQTKLSLAFCSDLLNDPEDFLPAIKLAVSRGLSPEAALAALTTNSAELLGLSRKLGSLEVGKQASLVVTDGPLFEKGTKVLETWVDGQRYPAAAQPSVSLEGRWEVTLGDQQDPVTLDIIRKDEKLRGSLLIEDSKTKLKHLSAGNTLLNFVIDTAKIEAWQEKGPQIRLSGVVIGKTISGRGRFSDGSAFDWIASRQGPVPEEEGQDDDDQPQENGSGSDESEESDQGQPKQEEEKADKAQERQNEDSERQNDESKEENTGPRPALLPLRYPLSAWGRLHQPDQPTAVLFKNATVWTCGPQGVLPNARVLIQAGKVTAVGPDLAAPKDALVVDLQGKHLTPGLIDCHSHSATDGGINEATQTITAEVRIGDFVDSDDVNIYRQLSCGITCINVLHGSANTIGGQNQVLKLRWGRLPEEMKFRDAPPGIKFALGENVKQANWGDNYTTRYPQTRLGVEQLVRDAFSAAKRYAAARQAFDRGEGNRLPPRVDLELEALAEVLAGERLIHCHSYRQDEILALLRTCEEFGVKIGTLQHVLEGYKIADAIAAHGAGGSAFSDWWAYKFEVYDAIPFNGALMHKAGVVVSFNSDSAELARRMNAEAAKAVKYGGLGEEEALKFVTLNPAKQLGIQARVGSLEPGKDADLAIWSDHPLTSTTRCLQTWVDGRRYFDHGEDAKRRQQLRREHAALIARVLDSGQEPAAEPWIDYKTLWPREDLYCGHIHADHDHGHE